MKTGPRRFAPAWLALVLAGIVTSPAVAQVYASEGATRGGSVVLSDFASDLTPELLVAAPPSPAATAPAPANATAPAPGAAWKPRTPPPAIQAIVNAVAVEQKIPARLLNAVIAAESNFNPAAVSAKGARGLMQLMPETARRFGARDIMSPHENVRAGAMYLNWLRDRFNDDLELVLAAYNAGEQSVLRAGRRVPDYAETRTYVPRVMALLQCPPAQRCTLR